MSYLSEIYSDYRRQVITGFEVVDFLPIIAVFHNLGLNCDYQEIEDPTPFFFDFFLIFCYNFVSLKL